MVAGGFFRHPIALLMSRRRFKKALQLIVELAFSILAMKQRCNSRGEVSQPAHTCPLLPFIRVSRF